MTLYPQIADVRERAATHNVNTDLMTLLVEDRFFGTPTQAVALAATSTNVATLHMVVQRALAATTTNTPTVIRRANTRLTATSTNTPTLTRQGRINATATTTNTPTLTRAANLTLTATSTNTGQLTRTTNLALAAITTNTPALTRATRLALLATTTSTALLSRTARLALAATTTNTGSLATTVIPVGPAVVLVLTVGPPGVRWNVSAPAPPKFRIGPPGGRWRVGRPTVEQYSRYTREYVPVPVSALVDGLPYDPTSDPVYVLFRTTYGSPAQADPDWNTATWSTGAPTGTYLANCLIGPGGTVELDPGTWQVWLKVTDTPEAPIRYSGQIQVLA